MHITQKIGLAFVTAAEIEAVEQTSYTAFKEKLTPSLNTICYRGLKAILTPLAMIFKY